MNGHKKLNGNDIDEALCAEVAAELGDKSGMTTFNPDPFFMKLNKAMPLAGSRIDWEKIPHARVAFSCIGTEQTSDFEAFFKKTVLDFDLSGNVIYIGDSATELAYMLPLSEIIKALYPFLSIAQHHYFIAENFSWCISFSFEGDMAFGFIP